MGILVEYKHNNEVIENAYVKIDKISLSYATIEKFESTDSDTLKLRYDKVPEAIAVVSIYTDKEARDNQARPVNYLICPFQFDIDSGENPYKVAYSAIKASDLFSKESIVDFL